LVAAVTATVWHTLATVGEFVILVAFCIGLWLIKVYFDREDQYRRYRRRRNVNRYNAERYRRERER
jgi:hypothetical protein